MRHSAGWKCPEFQAWIQPEYDIQQDLNSNTKFGLNSGLKFRAFSTRGVTGKKTTKFVKFFPFRNSYNLHYIKPYKLCGFLSKVSNHTQSKNGSKFMYTFIVYWIWKLIKMCTEKLAMFLTDKRWHHFLCRFSKSQLFEKFNKKSKLFFLLKISPNKII